ncbi:MAG: hypothetical protein EBT55_05585, partial [Proteobacteria bacterium]|nr:hypothetical protein [Pseudomonadota bacterium]
SPNGIKKFETSQYKNDFYQLVNFYQSQNNPIYCTVAVATTLLNVFNYPEISNQITHQTIKPNGEVIPFPLFSQDNFFNDKTNKIKHQEVIEFKKTNKNNEYDPGMILGDFAKILKTAYSLKTTVYYQKNSDPNKFREIVKKVINDDNSFLVINFDGLVLENKTRGHMSLVSAYQQDSDEVLVLDVALHKNQWQWVSLSNIVSAMNTKDGKQYRGYMTVEKL